MYSVWTALCQVKGMNPFEPLLETVTAAVKSDKKSRRRKERGRWTTSLSRVFMVSL